MKCPSAPHLSGPAALFLVFIGLDVSSLSVHHRVHGIRRLSAAPSTGIPSMPPNQPAEGKNSLTGSSWRMRLMWQMLIVRPAGTGVNRNRGAPDGHPAPKRGVPRHADRSRSRLQRDTIWAWHPGSACWLQPGMLSRCRGADHESVMNRCHRTVYMGPPLSILLALFSKQELVSVDYEVSVQRSTGMDDRPGIPSSAHTARAETEGSPCVVRNQDIG